ncbi:MAG: asparagine synthase (glutamine-hydrolyzing) [Myxococcales bacterium]|nr:asparagine synthase (glutamine-hydrolyzing) [Myxococcales bacterium]
MCGIAGLVAFADACAAAPLQGDAPARVGQMVAQLAHRGPDGHGIVADEFAALGHARLAIIDPALGAQPMATAGGDCVICFNGEIFNYIELRAELVALGYAFATASDTEVLLQAWHAWGAEVLPRLNGQYAFALWDRRCGELILARDAMGIAPLYVAQHAGVLAFASEVKAIFAGLPQLPRTFDPQGLAQVFSLWAPLAPTTVFAGVTELPPGAVWRYQLRGETAGTRTASEVALPRIATTALTRGWTPAHAAAELGAALHNATQMRLVRADVEVGCYLSGGVDSTLLALMAAGMAPSLTTLSLRFADAEFDEGNHQHAAVAAIAATTRHRHISVTVSDADIAAALPDAVWHAERPWLRTAPVPMFLLARATRQAGIKVVLTGEGADEWFGGYDIFREGIVRRFWARQPDSLARQSLILRLYPYLARSPVAMREMSVRFFAQGLEHAREPGFAHQTRWRVGAAIARLWSPEFTAVAGHAEAPQLAALAAVTSHLAAAASETVSPLAFDQYLELRTLMAGYLLSSQGDRMLLGNGVEGRFPFLDAEVTALAASLPDHFKIFGTREKWLLKRIAMGLVPDSIVHRPKQPYRAPDLRALLAAPWLHDITSPAACVKFGVFAAPAVTSLRDKLLRQHQRGASASHTDVAALVGVVTTHWLGERFGLTA